MQIATKWIVTLWSHKEARQATLNYIHALKVGNMYGRYVRLNIRTI
jgi:hypothetical protein